MVSIYALFPLLIGLMIATSIAVLKHRRAARVEKYLADLRKKSQVEQELSLATMEQILNELGERSSAFVMILPSPTNITDLTGVNPNRQTKVPRT